MITRAAGELDRVDLDFSYNGATLLVRRTCYYLGEGEDIGRRPSVFNPFDGGNC